MEQEILSARYSQLLQIIQKLLDDCEPHSKAFVFRILGKEHISKFTSQVNMETLLGEATYGGYPQVACLGFALGKSETPRSDYILQFLNGLHRLRNRSGKGLESFSGDDIAILGIADGLAQIEEESEFREQVDASKSWLLQMVDKTTEEKLWSSRMRYLAGDLLDDKGRLRAQANYTNIHSSALDITLCNVWPDQFSHTPLPSKDICQKILKQLLISECPQEDIEKAAVWLKTIDVLVDQASEILLPKQDADAIAALTAIKINIDRKAEWQARFELWLYIGIFVIVAIVLAILTYYLGWNVMEPWIAFIGLGVTLGGYAYFAITQKELSPQGIYKQLVLTYKKQLYQEYGFDPKEYEQLVNRTDRTHNQVG